MIFRRLTIIIALFCCIAGVRAAAATDSVTISKRLAVIERAVPLPYHRSLTRDIKQFSSKALPADYASFETFIDHELSKRAMPAELKYLPMSLSGMKADYDENGHCGIWAMPVMVALRYGLTVDTFHDERFAMERATCAALDYLSDLHRQYGDWWKSILAFANSPASLQAAALRHEGSAIRLWDYYSEDLLPDVNIIGDFMACYYVFSSENKMIIHSSESFVSVDFDQPLSLESISEATGVPSSHIKALNPVFRTNPLQPFNGYALCLPEKAAHQFESRLDALYMTTANAIQHAEERLAQKTPEVKKKKTQPVTYTVRSGDMLGRIASRFNVTIRQLKNWNNLRSDVIRPGQVLIVSPESATKSTATTTTKSSHSKGNIKTTYRVKLGDTLSAIARKHNVTVQQIKKWNGLNSDKIREGQRLTLYTKAS